jgi:hypothetical protein
MGYDFILMPLKKAANRHYPLSYHDTEPDDFDGKLPWTGFRAWVNDLGGESNGPSEYIVDYGYEGQICFRRGGSGEDCSCILLDMHADWKHALAAFRKLFDLEPNCCLIDEQTDICYDPSSFEQFIDECNREPG